MLDRDLAELYGVTTKALNQAIKRYIDRFPLDFMFQLTREETMAVRLRSQSVTLKRGQHYKYYSNALSLIERARLTIAIPLTKARSQHITLQLSLPHLSQVIFRDV